MRLYLSLLVWTALWLPVLAAGRTFQSQNHHFRAVFHGPVKEIHPRHDQVTFGRAPSDSSRDWEAISVLTGRLQKNPSNTLNYLVSEGVLKPHAGPVKNIQLGKVKGVEMTGLDDKGYPFGIRVISTSQATFVIMSTNIDLGVTRAFLDSFQLLPTEP